MTGPQSIPYLFAFAVLVLCVRRLAYCDRILDRSRLDRAENAVRAAHGQPPQLPKYTPYAQRRSRIEKPRLTFCVCLLLFSLIAYAFTAVFI